MKLLVPLLLLLAAIAAAAVVLFVEDDGPPPAGDTPKPAAERAVVESEAGRTRDAARPKIVVPPVEPAADEPEEAPLIEEEGTAETALEGAVVAPDGLAVQGAVVQLLREERRPGALFASLTRVKKEVHTDADGRFAFRGLAGGGPYVVRVEHGRYAPAERRGVIVPPGETIDLGPIRLPSGCRVVGTVLGPDGRAAHGVRVRAFAVERGRSQPLRQVLTDERGFYRLEHLPTGVVEIEVEGEGAARMRTAPFLLSSARPEVVKNFRLSEGLVLEGIVRAPDGQPLPGARIRARLLRGQAACRAEATSDERGGFRLTGLVRGPFHVVCERKGFARWMDTVEVGTIKRLRIVMLPTLGIAGRVVDPQRKPIPAFFLQVFAAEPDGRPKHPLGSPFKVRDEKGAFQIPDLEPGHYRIKVFAPGWAPTLSRLVELRRSWVQGVVVRVREGGRIAGRVTDAAGSPVAGALVRLVGAGYAENPLSDLLQDPSTYVARTRTAEDGSFAIEALENGTYQVRIQAPGFRLARVEGVRVKLGETTDVGTVQLTAGARLSGVVLGPSQVPQPHARLTLTHAETGEVVETTCDAEGKFSVDHLMPGKWTITAMATRRAELSDVLAGALEAMRASRTIELADGAEESIVLGVGK